MGIATCAACIPPSAPEHAKLEAAQVHALDLIFVGAADNFCAHGAPAQLRAVVTMDDSTQLQTPARGESTRDRLQFSKFEFRSSYGRIDERGLLIVPNDPFALLTRTVTVKARVVGRPEVASEVSIKPSFGCPATAGISARSGSRGRSGQRGQGGRRGNSASSSATAQRGQDGGNGANGGAGGHGERGLHVTAAASIITSPEHGRLVVVKVGRRVHLLSEASASFTLYATGGNGGDGGSGGSGGNGGSGGSASADQGNGGDGGDGGSGGGGGDGADGGSIALVLDSRYPELERVFRYSVSGGRAGDAWRAGSSGQRGSGGSSSSGTRGQDGQPGQRASSGQSGRAGRSGQAPSVVSGAYAEIFALEIAAGLMPQGE